MTQPRRVAATASARRVADETGKPLGEPGALVGYQVRFDAATARGADTRLVYVTDGVLLREMAADVLLRRYSVIVIDEAHERGVNTDVLLGLLSRALPLRNALAAEAAEALALAVGGGGGGVNVPSAMEANAPIAPLKLVIMSATMRTDDLTGSRALFPSGPPPVVTVPGRQHTVTAHFARTTELKDYVGAAVTKAIKVHKRLPDGGMLIFLTGQAEVEAAVSALRSALGRKRGGARARAEAEAMAKVVAAAAAAAVVDSTASAPLPPPLPTPPPRPVYILPLYAMLPRAAQDRVFAPPPEGARLIVVATNVAETSITIPGIR